MSKKIRRGAHRARGVFHFALAPFASTVLLAGAGSVYGQAVTVNSGDTYTVDSSSTVTGSTSSGSPGEIANGANGGIAVQVNAGGALVNHGGISGGAGQIGGLLIGSGGNGGAGVILGNGAVGFLNTGSITSGKGNNAVGESGDGGGGGTGVSIAASGAFSNSGSINGNTGGNGGLLSGNAGDGGMGVLITVAGIFSNTGSIGGSTGGNGSNIAPFSNGGNGGQGVLLTAGGTFTNETSGSVAGGGGGDVSGAFGTNGANAAGVELTAGGTVNNAGIISGHTGAYGVVFSGAAGNLTNSGTINGGASMGNFANQVTLITGGTITGDLNMSTNTSATLALDGSGTQTYSSAVTGNTTFAGSLIKQGPGTWTLDQSMNYFGNTSINAGTLILAGSASISNSPIISVASGATLAGSGTVNGNMNIAGAVTGSTTIHGDVALSSTGHIKGYTTITGALSGSGAVDPGNSPGLVTVGQIDPSGGMVFNFELAKQGAPDFANPSNIGNDVLRITGADPFTSALSSANAINLYLGAAAFNGGSTDIRGGFFTDSELSSGLAGDVDNSLLHIFIADPTGSTTYNGGTYSSLDLTHYGFDFTSVSQAAQFGTNTVNGAITDLRITTVPEPRSAVIGAALLGLVLSGQRLRRRKSAPEV